MHTPGPWKIDDPAIDVVVDQNELDIAITLSSGQHTPEEDHANARLIAAAPDLLAACKAFVEAWKKSHQLEKTDIALMMAEQAIEKAETVNQ